MPCVVDLRSDTVTKPTPQMRKAMAEAEVGDDVYMEDPTVNKLQEIAADMLGKEAALFVPSGTMGNLISILCHCTERGSEVIVGDQSHICVNEQGGISQFGGVFTKATKNLPDGSLNLAEIRKLYNDGSNIHHTKTAVIAVENAVKGKVLPLSYMAELKSLADELKVPVHLDGARLFNAVTALKISAKELTQYVDTMNICLSKNLCAPLGSVIVGSKDFITRARRLRKALGGGMRQAGIVAAAGIISLTEMTKRLQEDHNKTRLFARALQEVSPNVFKFNLDLYQTNILFFGIDYESERKKGKKSVVAEFCERMDKATDECPISVKMLHFNNEVVRVVFHNDITADNLQLAIKKLRYVAQMFDSS